MPKGKRGPRADVITINSGKQTDLPGVEPSARKIGEIEDLAEELQRVTSERVGWSNKERDAMENLIASMKRHDRVIYLRQTWGKVVLKEAKTKATVKLDSDSSNGDEENEEE